MYMCLHGGCNHKYKHPQDLTHHQETHQQERYECPMCDKSFGEKQLLKRHGAVHEPGFQYFCTKCGQGFKHNNQLYMHRQTCV